MKRIVCIIMLSLLTLSGCQGELPTDSNRNTVDYDGKTAVLLEDTELLNAYAGLIDENDDITWTAVSEKKELKKGDIVLAMKENDGITMIVHALNIAHFNCGVFI